MYWSRNLTLCSPLVQALRIFFFLSLTKKRHSNRSFTPGFERRGNPRSTEKWANTGSTRTATRADRRGELQTPLVFLVRGGQGPGPMSPHGKRLWPEATRQDWALETSTLVTMDSPGDVWWREAMGSARYTWHSLCYTPALGCRFFGAASRGAMREGAALASYDHPRPFFSYCLGQLLARITSVSEGHQTTHGNFEDDDHSALLSRSWTLKAPGFHPCVVSNLVLLPAELLEPRSGCRAKRVAHLRDPTRRISRPS